MTDTERPPHIGPARWRFAKLFEAALKEKTPLAPEKGWNYNSFAMKIKPTRQTVYFWCIAKSFPEKEELIDNVVLALYGDLLCYRPKREQLKGAWIAASQEPIPKEDPRAITRLRVFLMPPTLENIVDLIRYEQHTYDGTNHVIAAMKSALKAEKARISEAFVKLLVEPTSTDADWNIKEIVAAVMSKNYLWRPSEFELKSLSEMCRSHLASSSKPLSIASAMSVAMGRGGYTEFLEKTISQFILDSEHGVDDFNRVAAYYGSESRHYDGLMQHFKNKGRVGGTALIWANDTNCLLRLADNPTLRMEYKRALKPKLLLSADLLFRAGLEKEARLAATKANRIK